MSGEIEVKPCSSNNGPRSEGHFQETVEESDGLVQDQVIIAPEIMNTILEHLNLRSLKQVRLVCKSWLHEAQTHMIRKGIVRFSKDSSSMRIPEFIDTTHERLPELPQPFQSIDLDFSKEDEGFEAPPYTRIILGRLSSLGPALKVSRLSLGNTPLKLAFPLIIQNSSSLEYLKIFSETCESGYLPLMEPGQTFPHLKHIEVDLSDTAIARNHFPSIVAWIVRCSPRLEVYESTGGSIEGNANVELASELVLKVDLRNVKTLTLVDYSLNNEAMAHLLLMPFNQLQNLRMAIFPSVPQLVNFLPNNQAAVALIPTVANHSHTLKVLDLSDIEDIKFLCAPAFPVCPNVQELSTFTFPYGNNFVSNRFPSLQVLNVWDFDPKVEEHWDEFLPLLSVKTLRIFDLNFFTNEDSAWDDELEIQVPFFGKFPSLESLYLRYSLLVRCIGLRCSGNPQFANMLDGVKHLKVHGTTGSWSYAPFSSLAVLKDLESVAITSFNESVTTIPVKELPLLKVIQFPWDDKCLNFDKLLEVARGVEKVIITNCCSFLRVGVDPKSKELLEKFFDSLPNVECGRGYWDNMPPVHWQYWRRVERFYSDDDEEEDDYEVDDEEEDNYEVDDEDYMEDEQPVYMGEPEVDIDYD